MTSPTTAAALVAIILMVHASASAAISDNAPLPDRIEFNRDVRPILAENCYSCHGPDASQRKADLRLDTKDGLFNAIKDNHPVVPERADESELYRRITTDNSDDRMPEPKSGRRLQPRQIALIKKWIEQGRRIVARAIAGRLPRQRGRRSRRWKTRRGCGTRSTLLRWPGWRPKGLSRLLRRTRRR